MGRYDISYRLSWRDELNIPFRKEIKTIEAENIEEAISEFRNKGCQMTYPYPAILDILKIKLIEPLYRSNKMIKVCSECGGDVKQSEKTYRCTKCGREKRFGEKVVETIDMSDVARLDVIME
jgi:tRNA(Ile2) C34 agmatinyltransferase TiaS